MLPQVQREISKRDSEQDKKKYGHGVAKAFTSMSDKLSKDILRQKAFDKQRDY